MKHCKRIFKKTVALIFATLMLVSYSVNVAAISEEIDTPSVTRRYSETILPGKTITIDTPSSMSVGEAFGWDVYYTPSDATLQVSRDGDSYLEATDGYIYLYQKVETSGVQHLYLHNPSAKITLNIDYSIIVF